MSARLLHKIGKLGMKKFNFFRQISGVPRSALSDSASWDLRYLKKMGKRYHTYDLITPQHQFAYFSVYPESLA